MRTRATPTPAGQGRKVSSTSPVLALVPVCLLTLLGGPFAFRRPIDVSDGFESPALSHVWSTERSLPGTVTIQSRVVRAGRRAVEITLHPGDQLPDEKGSELERAELMEARPLTSHEGPAYEYSFSLFLPADFPAVPTRLVIAQWKQYCPSGRCSQDNPVVALRYQGGRLRVTLHSGDKARTLFSTRDEIRGRWLDFRFLIRFSRGDQGRIQAWLDGRRIVDYAGATAYSEAFGFPPAGLFFFKMGLYRDRASVPMTIYIDEYRKKELAPSAAK